MLQAARRRHDEGDDVVIGVVETHGRSETAALLAGLEVLPQTTIEYHNHTLKEFDLDAALARHPQLILVDELAHSNAPGARHLKRWQDVQELIDAGIDVYTTVNVQHLESLNDVVGQITGIRVFETLPDRVLDGADEVTLVDLPPEELLERLSQGKVYMPQQAEHAVRNFFRKGNLIALRELALRRTADRVDAQMREYRADRSIERIWQARDRLLVCVGPGSDAPALVRAAARLAASLKADWIAAYVETPRLQKLPGARRERTMQALKFAAELGAETVTLAGADAVATLIGYAQARNVSKLVAGASSRRGVARLLLRPFSERLAERAGDLDLTLIRASDDARSAGAMSPNVPDAAARAWRDALSAAREQRSPPRAYAYAGAICAAITVIASLVSDRIDLTNLVMLYLLGVMFTAVRLGRGPGVMLSFLSRRGLRFLLRAAAHVAVGGGYAIPADVRRHAADLARDQPSHVEPAARGAHGREARAAHERDVRDGRRTGRGARDRADRRDRHAACERSVPRAGRDAPARQRRQGAPEARSMPTTIRRRCCSMRARWISTSASGCTTSRSRPAAAPTRCPRAAALYLPLKAPMRTRGVLAVSRAIPRELDVPEQQAHARRVRRADRAGAGTGALRRYCARRARQHGVGAAAQFAAVGDIARFAHAADDHRRLRVDARRDASGDTRSPADDELIEAIHEESLRMSESSSPTCSTWRACRRAACG